MCAHPKNQIVRAQVNQPGVLGSSCCTLDEPETVERVGVRIVLAGLLDNPTWDGNVGALLECDTCSMPYLISSVFPWWPSSMCERTNRWKV